MTTPLEWILEKLPDAKKSGTCWSACCPAHDDRRASLSIAEGEDGRVLLKCHAGCSLEAICEAMGLKPTDLFVASTSTVLPAGRGEQEYRGQANGQQGSGAPQIAATYDYRDERGELLFQVVRYDPKDFRQRRPKPGGGWVWLVKGVRVVPYRLPELLARPDEPVFVVEGEKDVDNLGRIGVLATCNAGGAGKWTAEHAASLGGRRVYATRDNDDSGLRHIEQVTHSLHGNAEWVRIVELPGLPAKGDVSDWIAAGGTKQELMRLAEASPIWAPPTQPWPEIISLDTVSLPEFPTHTLPGVLREWVEAESHATQTPADLAGLLALAVCSSTIARRVVVEPRPGWPEPVNLYVAVLLEPGNRKSAVFSDATRPLGELEAELIEAARPSVARAQSDRRQSEGRLKRLEKLAAEKGDAEARHEAGNLAEELALQVEPVLPRLIVDDATSEKLGMMLAEQGGRIASMSPEGGVFDLMAGLYSKNGLPQFGVYLMGHSGDNLKSDRVSRSSVYVERPALTCAYAMQPQVIVGLAANAAFRGRGLLARFLYAAPQSWIGRRLIAPPPVPDTVRDAYHGTVKAMADIQEEKITLNLAAEAAAALEEWEAGIEAMLADGGQMEIMRDWGGKLAGATLRLAAVLHCVDYGPTGEIDLPTLAAAIEIARYLVPHAEAVLNMMQAKEGPGEEDAQYVLRWIERHGRREFTKRDAQQQGKRRFPKADDIDPALNELTRRGYIRLRPIEATSIGRPPSPTYDVNPVVSAEEGAEIRSQNSQNATERTESGGSENIESALGRSTATNRVQVTI
ncbi:MAG: DUF3987 domain-containing protein [Pirellulales bacterium]